MKKLLRTFVILILCCAIQNDCFASIALKSTDKAIRNTITASSTFATPDAPTNLVATPINIGGMIQFTAPTSDGGSAITNYEYSTDNGATWVTPSPAVTTSPLIISSGLTNCTSYQVKIRAVNAEGIGAASIAATLVPSTSSDFGVNWAARTSAADNQWQSVAYGNGLFVAVSTDGTNRVMTSPDGITWTARTSAADNQWRSVTYGNSLFVAVTNTGTGNRVMTSPDGITWTIRTSAADNSWTSVTYGNGLFVAVSTTGTGNRVMTSPDGITWTIRTSAADNSWSSIAYGNSLFVAVANSGTGNRVMTSQDGITWTIRTSAAENNWRSITYGNGLFVAVSSNGTGNRVMTSPDGITWTIRTSAAENTWQSVTYGNGKFVAVAVTGSGNRVMTSPDGITWTIRTTASDNTWQSVTYGNGLFVAVSSLGTSNRVMTSIYDVVADAPVISAINARNDGAEVIFSNTASVYAPGIGNYEYSTDDGNTWILLSPSANKSPLTITGLTNATLYNIKIRATNSVGASCASSSVSVTPSLGTVADAPTNLVVTPINTGGMITFTAPANDGGSSITNYEYSIDGGSNWITPLSAITASPIIISSGLTNCTSYQVKIKAVNATGSSAASLAATLVPSPSTDFGRSWSQRVSAADNNWSSVTYGNGLFVAVANSGTGNRVMTSPDETTWISRTSAVDNSWASVTYGNGLFVAVSTTGTGNRVMTSPNGIDWISRTSAADNSWASVTYGNGLFVAVSTSGTGNRVMTSPNGIDWASRTSAAANSWSSVTYGNSLFVAVSSSGTGNRVMTSPDGITWTSRTSAADNNWSSVTYGNGLFVAVATSGTGNRVMTSPDGINWTIRTSAAENNWRSITYGNGLFVAVSSTGTSNRVMTSPDGIDWTARTSASDNSWSIVTYGNGLFVAVSNTGTGNRVMTSSFSPVVDAPVINNISPRNNAASVAFTQTASAKAPAVSNYEYSTDNGSTWTARNPASNLSPMIITGLTNATTYNIKIRAINSVGTSCTSNMMSVTPALGTVADAPTNLVANPIINSGGVIQFNAPANDGGSDITNYEYSTDNGATWVTPSPAVAVSPLTISSGLTNCTSYQIKLRAVNASGAGAASVMTSLTPIVVIAGFKWTTKTSAADNDWRSVTYGNGLFVAVARSGNFNRVMTSPDGTSWTVRNTPVNNNYESVTYGNGLFVAVAITGTGNRVMTSPDGITWTARTSAADNLWYGVTYANDLFVAVAANGVGNRVMTSPDGITWTSRASAVDNQWTSVTFGNGLFVAVANSGTGNRVMTSPDGITWTSRTSATDNSWYSVTFGNGIFVAVSYDGSNNRVMTSSDGINWTERTSASDNSWNRVTYGNGLFVAVAQSGTSNRVMTSTDGIAWTSRTTTAENNWYDITYGNGLFVAVAWSGTGNRVMTGSNAVVADAPVISSVLGNQIEASISFTQTTPALTQAIINYQYSIDNGASWTVLSPAATTSPITVTGLTDFTNQIQLQAINSVGNSCAAIYSVAFNLNKFGQKTSTGSDFVNKNGALGISGIRASGESRTFFPVLSATAAVIDITTTTASSGGTVGADGGAFVTARGVCWSTTTNPTTLDSKTVDGTGTETFTSAITGLTSGTTYYVRSYATNSVGTTFGPEVSFTTL